MRLSRSNGVVSELENIEASSNRRRQLGARENSETAT